MGQKWSEIFAERSAAHECRIYWRKKGHSGQTGNRAQCLRSRPPKRTRDKALLRWLTGMLRQNGVILITCLDAVLHIGDALPPESPTLVADLWRKGDVKRRGHLRSGLREGELAR